MSIPFHAEAQLEELGLAAFLKIISYPNGQIYEGALFLINARGEPREFTYNRIDTPYGFLWRKDDIRQHAVKILTASLLSLCPQIPCLIFCLAAEIASELFCQDIKVSIPVCRLASSLENHTNSKLEEIEVLPDSKSIKLFWLPAKPDMASLEYRLMQELAGRGLLLEPFERSATGLREIYGADS